MSLTQNINFAISLIYMLRFSSVQTLFEYVAMKIQNKDRKREREREKEKEKEREKSLLVVSFPHCQHSKRKRGCEDYYIFNKLNEKLNKLHTSIKIFSVGITSP